QDLDSVPRTVGQSSPAQRCFVNARAILETVEGVEVHREISRGVPGVVKPTLGNAADQRHLPAFETDADRTAGAGRLAPAAAAAGLAMPAGFTLPEAFATVFCARTGL